MTKFEKYFIDNSIDYSNKTVAITGATGSLGFYIAKYMMIKNAKLVLIGRNISKLEATKNDLLLLNKNADITLLKCDFSNILETKKLAKLLQNLQIDYLFNNAGCYHLPVKMNDQFDITYITNYFSPIYLTNYLCRLNKNLVVIQTGSLSYKFSKIKIQDFQSLKKSKMIRYANSKRLLALTNLKLQEKYNNSLYLTHPGVSATGLFSSSKGGVGKAFSKIILPIMKVLFMKPEKAALCIALAPSYTYKKGITIGPRGLFEIWGYPKQRNLTYNKFSRKEKDNIDDIISKTFNF